MTWKNTYFTAVLLLVSPSFAAICPESCVCSTTRDGLHRATCSSLLELYKFTIRQKHHNINIVDLSHSNITKLTHELDRLTEVVSLDLSTNGIIDVNKFLQNAKKLVHLNLSNNRIRKLSLTQLPMSISSLDLTNNVLVDVPSDLDHLKGLEHFELEGNPIDCSCSNILSRDRLLALNVIVDNVKCATPENVKQRPWLELKTKDICKMPKMALNYLDMMMGDEPVDAKQIANDNSELKSVPVISNSDLDDGKVIQPNNEVIDDDNIQFIKVGHVTSSSLPEIDGSGDGESTTISSIYEPPQVGTKYENILANDEIISVEGTTEDTSEGSGEGSGADILKEIEDYSYTEETFSEDKHRVETTTPVLEELNPGPVMRIFEDELNSTEYPLYKSPTVFEEGSDWYSKKTLVENKEIIQETSISEPMKITPTFETVASESSDNEQKVTHKTGTYVCIALIVVLLVGLIAFAITKGQMRKRRDRRLLRQQRRDVEKASKEMVPMNESLLGKPAALDPPIQKKLNGKYELVPTHETHQKSNGNGDVSNGVQAYENNGIRTNSPRDSNQNKNSSKDNNLVEGQPDTSLESANSNDTRKDNNSLSSEDIFIPLNGKDSPKLNGNTKEHLSKPFINGDNLDTEYLPSTRDYVPVYSPDMGRVRIKMSEIPKPKTPVLVTRSRSNAGDIIITPSADGGTRNSTT